MKLGTYNHFRIGPPVFLPCRSKKHDSLVKSRISFCNYDFIQNDHLFGTFLFD
jgi:hypothetical protein